jgi:hypothetical protein
MRLVVFRDSQQAHQVLVLAGRALPNGHDSDFQPHIVNHVQDPPPVQPHAARLTWCHVLLQNTAGGRSGSLASWLMACRTLSNVARQLPEFPQCGGCDMQAISGRSWRRRPPSLHRHCPVRTQSRPTPTSRGLRRNVRLASAHAASAGPRHPPVAATISPALSRLSQVPSHRWSLLLVNQELKLIRR